MNVIYTPDDTSDDDMSDDGESDEAWTGTDSGTVAYDQSSAVTISVTVNPAPTANYETTTDEDTPVSMNISDLMDAFGSDGTGFTFADFEQPENGTVTLDGTVLTYTPSADFNGQDEFVFRATNGTTLAYGYENFEGRCRDRHETA
jgi:hypothetical protein